MSDDKPPTRSIEQTIEIDAPVEVVWKAISEGEELAKWFPLDARVTPGVGGEIWMSWPGMEFATPITVWEPNRHLQTGQHRGPQFMSVDYFLEARGGKTILRLVHSGFGADADWDGEYDDTVRGWSVFLRNLRHYLTRHRGRKGRQVLIEVPIEGPLDEAWQAFTRGLGLGASLQEGARYAATAPNGERLEGVVGLVSPPRIFAATVEGWNDAMLTADFQACGPGQMQLWFVALTYGLPDEEVEALRERWTPLLNRLLRPA